jgi:hypothetical protein
MRLARDPNDVGLIAKRDLDTLYEDSSDYESKPENPLTSKGK